MACAETRGEAVIREDLEAIASADFIDWDRLSGANILVTGATGLIGHMLVRSLLWANGKHSLGLQVLALVRDEGRARGRFAAEADNPALHFIAGSVEDLPEINVPVDFIVNGASLTGSRAFVEKPVEVIRTAVAGTMNTLELAREKRVRGYAHLSSMEVYGHPEHGHKVKESDACSLSPLAVRGSYPIAKAQCESLCVAYANEHGVPARVIRLTQTFGPGVDRDDSRVFAYFGRCVAQGESIVLKTRGETERSYLYVADSVTAILTVLLSGEDGRAYNAADEATYCSIAKMAKSVADMGGIRVTYKLEDGSEAGFLDMLFMDLDTSALQALGWHPALNSKRDSETASGRSRLKVMFERMISCWDFSANEKGVE